MSTTTPGNEPILGSRAAIVLGSVLLVGFAGMAWLTSLDRQERTELEAFEHPSAAGMPAIVLPPGGEPGENAVAIFRLKEVPYYGEDIVNHSDGTMMKAAVDDTGEITVYRRIRRNKLQKEHFVKLAPGRFLEVAPREEKQQDKAEKPVESAPE